MEESFLAALELAPEDNSLALVYADWLEEHGSPESNLIRIGVENGVRSMAAAFSTLVPIPLGNNALGVVQYAHTLCQLNSLLAHPDSRNALLRLASGRTATYRQTPTSFCPKRKIIAAAKNLLAERIKRRDDKCIADSARNQPVNCIRNKYLTKMRNLAVIIGRKYHNEVKSLYQSKFADVLYGHGGQETTNNDCYSKAYHRQFGPHRYLNAGARLDNENNPKFVIIENFRGTQLYQHKL